jgi:hypothetical protein
MTTVKKDIIIEELKDVPDEFADEVIRFIRVMKSRTKQKKIETHLASEDSLAKDWLKPEEDEAWKDL